MERNRSRPRENNEASAHDRFLPHLAVIDVKDLLSFLENTEDYSDTAVFLVSKCQRSNFPLKMLGRVYPEILVVTRPEVIWKGRTAMPNAITIMLNAVTGLNTSNICHATHTRC